MNWVKWAPWTKYKDHEDQDGDLPEGVSVEERPPEVDRGELGKIIYTDTRLEPPPEFFIQRKVIEDYGITRGCAGCSSFFHGTPQPHNEGCRERFRGLLKETAKMNNYERRKKEYEEKVAEREK